MDLGTVVLWALLLSVVVNVVLICILVCAKHSAQKQIDHSEVSETRKGNKSGKTSEIEMNPAIGTRQRATEVVIFPKTGAVYHRMSCQHVQQAAASQIETYKACKQCFK